MNVFRGAAGSSPATIVVFGGGLTPPMVSEMSRMSTTPNLCDIRGKDYQEVELVMLGAPVSVNVIHVPDPTGSGAAASTSQVQGLEHLAGITGNRITRLVGSSEARDDAACGVDLRLLSHHVCARGLGAQWADAPGEPQGQPAGRGGDDSSQRPHSVRPRREVRARRVATPRDMLRVGDVYRDLPLRAAAFMFPRGRRPTRPGSSSWWSRWKRRRR